LLCRDYPFPQTYKTHEARAIRSIVDGSGIDAWKVISLFKVLCNSFKMGNYYCRALNNPVKKAFSQVHHDHNTDDLVKIGTPPPFP
jgi:hypothetical protein